MCVCVVCVRMCVSVRPVDSLGINEDLKNKLQDVLIPERLLTLGHMLGKGTHNYTPLHTLHTTTHSWLTSR